MTLFQLAELVGPPVAAALAAYLGVRIGLARLEERVSAHDRRLELLEEWRTQQDH